MTKKRMVTPSTVEWYLFKSNQEEVGSLEGSGNCFVLSSRIGSDAVQRLLIVCQGKIGPGPPLISITVFASMAFSHTSTPLFSCPGQLNN